MNIYVGNLPDGAKSRELEKLFAPFGKVVSAAVARDKRSGVSRGFGFVEMATRHEGEAAIAALNEAEVGGSKLRVNEAHEREGRAAPGHAGRAGHGADRFDQQARTPFQGGRGGGGRGTQATRRGGKRGV
ncbi:MAG: RNA-binding protein [Candidatus Latescibacterota bacterium]